MTVHNGAPFLLETVDSVLAQSFGNFEFVVVDDGSTDDSWELLKVRSDPRISLCRNMVTKGISGSRNLLLDRAKGEYFAATDHDDLSFAVRLARQVAVLDAEPDVVLVASPITHLRGGRQYRDPMPVYTNPAALHMALFFGRHNITYSATCFRLSALRDNGIRFRPEYHYAEDFELYHRIAKTGKLAMLKEPLVAYRIHGGNTSLQRYSEMTANGQSFLRHAYKELLERDVSVDEIATVWRLAVEEGGAKSRAELARLGALISEVLAAFEGRFKGSTADVDAVRAVAGEVWWSVVRNSAGMLGRLAFAEGRAWRELGAGTPPLPRRVYWYLSGRGKQLMRKAGIAQLRDGP